MPSTAKPRTNGAGKPAAVHKLPPVTVAKFEQAGVLIERMVAENTELFIANGRRYKDAHRAEFPPRSLSAEEAVQLAAAALDDRPMEQRTAAFQASDLRVYDEPQPIEVLAAAGVATAPAFVRAARRVVALIEMDNARFEQALEDDALDDEIDADAAALGSLDMLEARPRAAAVMAHFAVAAGADPGKGLGLLAGTVWQALQNASRQLVPDTPSAWSWSTDSPQSTDGTGEPSSMDSGGSRPSS